MAENKTIETDASVDAFIKTIPDEKSVKIFQKNSSTTFPVTRHRL